MPIAPGQSAVSGYDSDTVATTTGVATQATGSTFVVGVLWYNGATVPAISDSKGNSYTQIGSTRQFSSFWAANSALFYCQNGSGGSGHTFTATKSAAYPSIFVVEITGALTTGVLDQQNSAADDTSSPVTSGNITTTQADELLVGFMGCEPSSLPAYTQNNSFILLQELRNGGSDPWEGCIAYRVVASTLTTEYSVGVTNLTRGSAHVASFKADPGGGGSGQPAARRQGRKPIGQEGVTYFKRPSGILVPAYSRAA